MEEHRKFSPQEAREIGERIGIDWDTARSTSNSSGWASRSSASTAVVIPS
jgi:hypothetical protein